MTRNRSTKFRQLVVVLAMGAGALGLAIGTAGAAAAAPTWGGPTPQPTAIYTPPQQNNDHHAKVTCEFSLLTEHDVVADPRGADEEDQYGQPQAAPSYTDPAGQPSGAPVYGYPDHQRHLDQVEVVQEVRFCVFEGEHGRPDQVKVWDVTQPFAWVQEDNGGQMEPDPGYLPSGIRSALAK